MSLTEVDRAILDFAGRRYRNAGAHNDAVARELGLSPTRYWQRLNRLLDDPAALAYAPVTVGRLRRVSGRESAR